MAVSPKYEKYEYTAQGANLRSQSIVECRLSDWSDHTILAVRPSVVLSGAEVVSGEVRYGGKLYFSVVAAAEDGTIVGAERGAEFSHKADCESAAPVQKADVFLKVEKTEIRQDGRSIILSAIVTAEISLYVPAQLEYLGGGSGVVCDFLPARCQSVIRARGSAEIEEEFDTDYVGDVLLHSEEVCLTRVFAAAGSIDVSGEINLGVVAKREGENEIVSYERMIPFRAEIPCDEAVSGMACQARVNVTQVNVSAVCEEDKNRCRILAQITLDICGKVYRSEEIVLPRDVFVPGYVCAHEKKKLRFSEPVCAFTATERIGGTAAIDRKVDFSCALQASALARAEVAAIALDGEITAEGVIHAVVFYKDSAGAENCVKVSLPFSFPVRSDRARRGMHAEVCALVCGVAVRQKTEGELEAEGTLKLFVTLETEEEAEYVGGLTVGQPQAESQSAIGVYVPSAGDTLWETAKKLGKQPEEVQKANPELTFPLSGKERIIVYRKKQIGF